MKIALLLCPLLPLFAISQDFDKWQKAVVNIEHRYERYNMAQVQDTIEKLQKQGLPDSIRSQKLMQLMEQKDVSTGTAIYLSDKNRKYLITASHVIGDTNIFDTRLSIRIPYDSYSKGKINTGSIMLNPLFTKRVFDSFLDISIISLQSEADISFIRILENNGNKPLSLSDIDTSNLIVGQDIFTVGYPTISSVQKISFWNEEYDVVLPITTFGKVAAFRTGLRKFVGDIATYPGNSGGPIISNNKLIGVTVAQNTYPTQILDSRGDYENTPIIARGLLAIIVRSNEIISLLRKLQIIEDKQNQR